MSRRVTRSQVADLEDHLVATANDTVSEDDDTLEPHQSIPKPKRLPAQTKPAKAKVGIEGTAAIGDPKSIIVRGKVLPLRSPQPGRTNRNTHPGMIVAPRAKRSPAEVAAAVKHKADLRRRADDLERQRIETLAEMELQEELDDEAEEHSVVRKQAEANSLDAADDVEMQSDDREGTDTSFAEAASNSEQDSDSEASDAIAVRKVAPKQKQRKRKAAKRETQAAVDKAKASLKAAGKRKAIVELQTTNDRKRAKASCPSGLVRNWQSKLSAPTQTSSKARVSEPNAMTLGGLDDEDASATFSLVKLNLKGTTCGRRNDTVAIDSPSEGESDSIPAGSRTSSLKNGKPKIVRKRDATTPDVKPNSKSKPCSAISKLSTPELQRASPASDISVAMSDTNVLPEFARSAWSTTFLPTLYNRLACASDPFVIDSDMVKVVQEIVEMVYPNTEYQVRLNDKIFTMAKDRLNEKRCFFGRQAIKIVTEFFKDEAYSKPKERARYAQWAIRGDGPALFGRPTPIDGTVDKNDDSYIPPEDIFESKFIIQLLSQFLQWCQDSCYDFGKPVGALALAATAVERAFMMYLTGLRVNQGQFSRDVVGTIVGDHAYTASRLSNRRWKKLMTLCGTQSMEEQPSLKVHSAQLNRRALYQPSSGSDNE